MVSDIDMRKIDDHPAGAVQFFKVMMRLEYALKANGYAEMNNNRLEICWDRFANESLGMPFFNTIRDSGKANTLIDNPPSHQKKEPSGGLAFRQAEQVVSIQGLLGALRRVRNNLFHGGKSGDVDHGRNDALIAESIYVTTELLLVNDDLRTAFEGRY
jgi:hypothetical protein